MSHGAGASATGRAPAPQPTAALVVEGLSKSYGSTRALDNVDLCVRRGSIHALLGGNGSGKSTLIKVLAGVERAESGGVIRIGRVGGFTSVAAEDMTPRRARVMGLYFVHQEPAMFPDLSISENLALGSGFIVSRYGRVRWRHQKRHATEVLGRFGIRADPSQPVADLRPAEQTLLSIARALQHQSGDGEGVLILDEPTATLPRDEVDRLLQTLTAMAERGQAIVLVSHRLDEVCRVAHDVTVLRDGRRVITEALGRYSTQGLATMIMGHEMVPAAESGARSITRRKGPRVAIESLYAGPLQDISLEVYPGEVVGLAGLIGSGRTSVLRAVYGDLETASGRIVVDGREIVRGQIAANRARGIVMVPENRRTATYPDLPVAINLTGPDVRSYWRRGVLDRRRESADAARTVADFGIKTPSPDALLSSLSGGNQQKVMMAAALRSRPSVLLLDEPTQGVDVGARADIHEIIRRATAEGSCAIVVSSDLDELEELCDRVVGVSRGRLCGELVSPDIDEGSLIRLMQGGQAA